MADAFYDCDYYDYDYYYCTIINIFLVLLLRCLVDYITRTIIDVIASSLRYNYYNDMYYIITVLHYT